MLGPAGSGLGCVWYMTFWIENDDERRTTMMRAVLIGTTIRDTIHPFSIQSPSSPPTHIHTHTHTIIVKQSEVKKSKYKPPHPIPVPSPSHSHSHPIPIPIPSQHSTSATSPHLLQPRQGKAEVATIPHLTSHHLITSHLITSLPIRY